MIERTLKRKKKGGISMERKERGITLIALVLTIIVMLILVAVSINVAVNGGLFKKAGEAVKKTEFSKLMEDWMVERWGNHTSEADEDLNGRLSKYFYNKYPQFEDDFIISNGKVLYIGLDEEISQFVEEQGGVKAVWIQDGDTIRQLSGDTTTPIYTIGQEVSYTPTRNSGGVRVATADSGYSSEQTVTQQVDGLTWKILGVDLTNTNNLLITTGAPTPDVFCLLGAQAYNNGPNIMNRVCEELYSKGDIKARSMTIEDVNNCLGFNPTRGIYYDGEYKALPSEIKNLHDLAKSTDDAMVLLWGTIAGTHTEQKTFMTPDGKTDKATLGNYPLDAVYYNLSSMKIQDLGKTDKTKEITSAQKNLIFGPRADYVYWLASLGVKPDVSNRYAVFGPGSVCSDAVETKVDIFCSDGCERLLMSAGRIPSRGFYSRNCDPAD